MNIINRMSFFLGVLFQHLVCATTNPVCVLDARMFAHPLLPPCRLFLPSAGRIAPHQNRADLYVIGIVFWNARVNISIDTPKAFSTRIAISGDRSAGGKFAPTDPTPGEDHETLQINATTSAFRLHA
jgi:hypothetical protein